ncbi:MAG TPA: hypothetical protein VMU47_25405 [Caldimonas sp.]|nr:hypothetical protein [Caldimonas sp.]
MTPARLAVRLGINQSQVSKSDRGERALDVLLRRAWLRAIGAGPPSFAETLDDDIPCVDAPPGWALARAIRRAA